MHFGIKVWLGLNIVALLLSAGYGVYCLARLARWNALMKDWASRGVQLNFNAVPSDGGWGMPVRSFLLGALIFGLTTLCVWSGHFIIGIVLQVVSLPIGYIVLRSLAAVSGGLLRR